MSWLESCAVWLQVGSTLYMVGVIWYVQLVHYPLMAHVGDGLFVGYHGRHTRRTGWVVVGPMLVEAATATVLLWPGIDSVPRPLAVAGFLLVAAIWISTFAIQVPLHRCLARGFDADTHRRLVRTNWIRTVLWSARGGLAIAITAGIWRS
jgi:hypothetical protein